MPISTAFTLDGEPAWAHDSLRELSDVLKERDIVPEDARVTGIECHVDAPMDVEYEVPEADCITESNVEQGDTFYIDPCGDTNLNRYRGMHFMVVRHSAGTLKCIDTNRRNFDLVLDEYPHPFYEVDHNGDIVDPRRTRLEHKNVIKQ